MSGGVFGASVAWHLACERVDVVVVERAHEGRATSAGAGIVCTWTSKVTDPVWYDLAAAAGRYYPTLIDLLGEDGQHEIGYRKVGSIVAPSGEAALDAAEHLIRQRAVAAPEAGAVSRLTPAEARELFPPLRTDLGAVHIAGAARVDGRLLASSMLAAAQKRGARIISGLAEPVKVAGAVRSVRVDGETLGADKVVVTGGAWGPALLAPLGVALRVAPQRGQIIHLRLPGTDTTRFPVVQPLNDHYLLAFDDSRVVVGATRETGSNFDYRVTAAGVAEVLDRALSFAPGLANATLHEIRIGFRPISADGRAFIGPVLHIEGLLIGNGLGPSGLTLGPFAGRLLAQLALGTRPDLDVTHFDPLRR